MQDSVSQLNERPHVYVGSKVITFNSYHYATLFEASEAKAIIGRTLSLLTDSVSVCNGDVDASDHGIFAYMTSAGAVHLRIVATTTDLKESGRIRVNYALFVAQT